MIIVFLHLSIGVFSQINIPEKPTFIPAVVDSTQTLSKQQFDALSRKLLRYSDSTSTELFVMIITSTFGEEIKFYTTQLAHKWEIGQKGKDNGVVVLLAKNDRKVTIQTGYGVEHLLTDALSKRIIENIMIPEFKSGNFYTGLDKGTDVIFEILKGTYKNDATPKSEGSGIPFIVIVFIIFIILLSVFSNKKNGGGNNRRFRKDSTASAILQAIILSRAGRRSC